MKSKVQFPKTYTILADILFVETNQILASYEPGSLIANRYKIVRHLATGAMGSVFIALDSKLGDCLVALKLLHPQFQEDQVAFKRFSNEVIFARKLNHPNIVRIYDFEDVQSRQKIISMEYVQGITLAQLVLDLHGESVDNGPTSSALYEVDFLRVLTIYKKILQGVSFAHRAGILHRDLKPSNIFLDENDEPKVGDFGLATIAGVSSGLTNDGKSLIGTPDYMAPEQVLGQKMTSRSDIYSLGILAYELVSGRVPFIADGPLAVAFMQVQEPFPELEDLPGFIPRNFLHLIKRATQKDPKDRFSGVEEMIEMLEYQNPHGEIRSSIICKDSLKSRKATVIPVSKSNFGSRPASFSKRHPTIFAAITTFVIITLGLSTFILTTFLVELDRGIQSDNTSSNIQAQIQKSPSLNKNLKRKKI